MLHRPALTGLLGSALLAASAWATVALASPDDHAPQVPAAPKIDRVPYVQAEAFGALRSAAVTDLPTAVIAVAGGDSEDRYGLNPSLARAVTPPGSDARRSWYVVPGSAGICLQQDDAGVCNTTEKALAGQLFLMKIKPQGKSAVPPPGSPIEMTVEGLVPDGVTAVAAVTKGGAAVSGELRANTFRVAGTNLATLRLERSGAAPLTIDLVG